MMARMMRMVILIVLLSTLVITISGIVIYSGSVREYAYDSTAEIQNQVQESMDAKMQSVSNVLKTLSSQEDVQAYFKVDADEQPDKRLFYETKVRQILKGYSDIYTDYLSIVAASEKGQYLSNESYRILRSPLSSESWYQKAIEAGGEPVIIGADIERNLTSWKNYSVDSYISVAQAVLDVNGEKPLGVIIIDWDIKSVQALLQNITLGKTGFVFVMDPAGTILYTPKNKTVYRIRPDWFQEKKKGSTSCMIEGRKYNLIYNQSSLTGLTTVGVYDTGKTIEGVTNIKYTSVIIALLTLVVGSIYAFAFSRSFTKPIKKLSKLMKKAQTGDFSVSFEDSSKGEIRQLGESFNSMMDQTNHLIKLVYKEQKNKRDAEMKILQEQIKPHFLYNTLDTIQWMAKKYQAMDIVDIVMALSHFFRISLSRGKEFITLQDEFTMVKSYLDIQKYRYEGMFEYSAEYEDGLETCEVIKLILQPIVENALYHGIKESEDETGNIWIYARKESEHSILITVEDDGAGISEEQCEYLNEIISTKNRTGEVKSFGVINVSDRIKMAYGEEYGLTYSQREGGGTKVEIRTKRYRKGENRVENRNSR